MKTLAAISASMLLIMATPAFAASATGGGAKALKNNGSANGAGYSHAAQPGAQGTQSGKPAKTKGAHPGNSRMKAASPSSK